MVDIRVCRDRGSVTESLLSITVFCRKYYRIKCVDENHSIPAKGCNWNRLCIPFAEEISLRLLKESIGTAVKLKRFTEPFCRMHGNKKRNSYHTVTLKNSDILVFSLRSVLLLEFLFPAGKREPSRFDSYPACLPPFGCFPGW